MPDNRTEEEKEAWAYSVRVLNTAAKSSSQMRERLIEKGYTAAVAGRVLQELEKIGYIDDRRYAESLFRQLTDLKPSGRSKLVFEWKRKGLAKDVWEPILDAFSEDQEFEYGFAAAERKWQSCGRYEMFKRKKKVYDFLVRRGFSFQLTGRIVDEVIRRNDLEKELNEG